MIAVAFRSTSRLLLRSYWIWSVTVLVLAVLYLLTRFGDGVGMLLELYHMPVIFGFFFLGQMLATVYDAQQERGGGVEEIQESLPYRPVPLVLGRLGAVYALWLAAGSLIYAAGVLMAVVLKGHSPVWFLLLDWALLVPVTLLFTTAIAYGIGRWLGRGFAPYLVVLVLFLIIAVPQMASEIFRDALGSGPMTILDVTLSAYFDLSVSPFYPDWAPLVINRLMTVTAAIGVVAWLIWTVARRRRDRVARPVALVVTAAVVAGAVILTANRMAWAGRMARKIVEETAYGAPLPVTAVQTGVAAVGAYDVDLAFETERMGLTGVARLDLTAPGETATFTLNRSFSVTELVGPDGEPRAFARNGDVVIVETKGQSGVYTFRYRGWVNQWRQDFNGGVRLAAHIDERSVMLPASLAWYPVPGVHTLAYRGWESGVVDAGLAHAPAPFRLTVNGLGDLTVLTNAQGGRPVTAAWLIGTVWESRTVTEGKPPRSVVTAVSPGNLANARTMTAEYADELAFYESLVPLQHPFWLVEVPNSLWLARGYIMPVGYPGAMVLPDSDLSRRDNMVMHAHMLNWWWHDARTREEQEIHDVLTQFMAELYMRAVRNHPRAYITMIHRRGIDTPVGQEALKRLNALYDRDGAEGLGRLLRSWHQPAEPLTWQQVGAALGGSGR